MKRLPALSVACAVGLFVSATAHADLQIDDGSPAPAAHTVSSNDLILATPAGSGHLTQKGTSSPGAPIKGWANDVSLIVALKQIVPDGWSARRVGDVDVKQLVSWKGGKTWTDVLDGLASTYGLDISVNWDTHSVAIARSSGVAVASVKTLNATSAISADGIRMTTVTSTKPIGSAPAGRQWVLSSKMTLRENVEAWAKSAGWTVSWGAADYPIVADVALNGAIDADDGPVATVMKAYEDAEQPLVARVSEANRVIRVENRDYQQSPVSDTGMSAFPNLSNR